MVLVKQFGLLVDEFVSLKLLLTNFEPCCMQEILFSQRAAHENEIRIVRKGILLYAVVSLLCVRFMLYHHHRPSSSSS